MLDNPSIVVDLGSGYIKAGFAGDEQPRAVVPAIMGRLRVPEGEGRDLVFGAEAVSRAGEATIERPIQDGLVVDWGMFEMVLDYIFTQELRVAPEEQSIMLTGAPLSPKVHREAVTQILFDAFMAPNVSLVSNAVCALYAAGASSGVVVDIGHDVTHIVPVYEEFALPFSTLRMDLAGRDITAYLMQLLRERGHSLPSSNGLAIADDIKAKTNYIAADFAGEQRRSAQGQIQGVSYQMPGAGSITIGDERFRAPEVLFTPSLIGKEFGGLHEQVHSAIAKSDVEVRRELYQHIVLTGGSTLFPGLPERLAAEVKRLAPTRFASSVTVTALPNGEYASWAGASRLVYYNNAYTRWITREQYQEQGPGVVHQKCF